MSILFDSNAMIELAAISRDRYQRNGGGGAHKVYASNRTYYESRGFKEMSKFEQACIEMLHRYRQACEIARADYVGDCLYTKEGFYDGDSIPF
jgi:hypothetical protein